MSSQAPSFANQEIEESLRAKRIRAYLWTVTIPTALSIPYILQKNFVISLLGACAGLLFFALGYYALYVRKNSVVASEHYLIGCYLSVFIPCIADGMIRSSVLWMLPCLPLAASYLLGARAALINVGISIAGVICVFVFDTLLDLPRLVPESDGTTFFLRVTLLGIVGGYGISSIKSWRAQLTLLEDQQRELKVARFTAEEASRAKSQFLANMSHEIRTPMNGILGMTAHMMESNLPSSEQRESLEIVHRCSENLLGLLNDILDLSKVEAGKLEFIPEAMDLDEVAKEVREIFLAKANAKGLELVVQAPRVKEYHLSDPNRIRQVIANLVGNAIKFSDQGQVRITVEHGELRSTPDAQVREVCVSISDEGIGIPAQDLQRLFEEFEQVTSITHSGRGGTGLGLAISKRFVEALGGQLLVESQEGKGTVFKIVLPMNVVPRSKVPKSALASLQAQDELDLRNCRALVVDDNMVNCKVASVYLQRLGAVVDLAHNGQEALDLVKRLEYHVVLMDLRMPVMDGITATKAIRALDSRRAKTPIVALTAAAFAEDKGRCLAAGMNAFLAKPFRREALISCLRGLDIQRPEANNDVITLRRKAAS